MNHLEFENKLTTDYKCWFLHPSAYVPGTDKDATVLDNPDEFLLVFEKEPTQTSKGVKRIAESVGKFTYYANGSRGYMKTKVPTSTSSAHAIDFLSIWMTLKRIKDTLLFKLGVL